MSEYVGLQTLRSFGGFQSERDDALLTGLVVAASGIIDQKCGRSFSADEDTARTFQTLTIGREYRTPFEGTLLRLDEDLATEATSITGDPAVIYLPSVPPFWGIVRTDGAAWTSPITVTGRWAYSVLPPRQIEFAAMRLAKWLYELKQTTRGDALVMTAEGQVLMPEALPADVEVILRPFVKVRLAA